MNLKSQLTLYMQHEGLTPTTLARKSSVARTSINEWLTNEKSSPKDLTKLKRVADTLSTTVDHLCFGAGLHKEGSFREYESEINAGLYEVILKKVKR